MNALPRTWLHLQAHKVRLTRRPISRSALAEHVEYATNKIYFLYVRASQVCKAAYDPKHSARATAANPDAIMNGKRSPTSPRSKPSMNAFATSGPLTRALTSSSMLMQLNSTVELSPTESTSRFLSTTVYTVASVQTESPVASYCQHGH